MTKKRLDNIKKITIKDAIDRLKIAMKQEPNYAHAWHCNIAMMCKDSIKSDEMTSDRCHEVGNQAASRFMKMCFDVETSNDMLTKDK